SLAPLVLGLLERAMRTGRLSTFLGLGAAIGFTILSAQIQMAYHCLWFLGALFLVRLAWGAVGSDGPRGAAGRVRLVALFTLAVTVGVGIASIQLFPAVAYVKHPAGFSVRSDRTDYEHASSWSLHPEEVASMVVPDFCNAPRGYWGRNVFKYNSDYVGILTLFLAGLALARRRDGTRWFLGGLAVFCVLYSLGGWTPLHKLFYWVVPQVKLFRAPPLVMFGAAFGFSALAALAVHDLETAGSGRSDSRFAGRAAVVGLGVAGLVAVLGLTAGPVTSFWTDLAGLELDANKLRSQQENLPAFRNGALAVAALLAAGAVVVARRGRGRLPSRATLAVLLILAVVDLWRVDHRFQVVVDPARWTRPQGIVAQLAAESRREKFRVAPAIPALAFNELGYFGIESTLGFHDNELAWYRELRMDPAAQNLLATNANGYPLLAALNVRYILHDSPDYPNPLPVPDALPRFRLVEEFEVVSDRSTIAARLLRDDHDPSRTVILEEDPGFPSPAPDPAAGPPGTILSYEYDGNDIRAVVRADRPCLLVHAENWFPYWHAWRGEEELPILRADGTVRAVPLPPGEHELRFEFVSVPFEVGKRVSLGTLLLVLAGCGVDLVRGRRARA
ncbi:MAG TPA: hypothetical protein VKU85_07495, partial [bacterium]|nr:hypothetical protein [bacterium]